MSRYIIVRESGSKELLLIDTQTQRNMVVSADALADGALADGDAFTGIDLAVAISEHPDVVSRMYYSEAREAA